MIFRLALTLALFSLPSTGIAGASGSGLVIEVKEGQRVSVSGQTSSLAQLVSDLCTKTGVSLRGYEAGDRPITVSYVDLPLRDALQRMLRDETYMIGVRAGARPADVEVAWVHVTGSKSGGPPSNVVVAPPPPPGAASQDAMAPGSLSSFGVESNIVTQALGNQDAAARREAIGQLVERVEAYPGELDGFLAGDVRKTADELAAFPFAAEALHILSTQQSDPGKRAKLKTLIEALEARRDAEAKKPGFLDLMRQSTPK